MARQVLQKNSPKARVTSPTSQISNPSSPKDTASQTLTQFLELNTRIDAIIQRATKKNNEIDATQSVIDSQISTMNTNVSTIASQFKKLHSQLR